MSAESFSSQSTILGCVFNDKNLQSYCGGVQQAKMATAAAPRRRRKRARISADGTGRKPQTQRRSITALKDDYDLSFLDDTEESSRQEQPVLATSPLPILLDERRSGRWRGRQLAWQAKAISRVETTKTSVKSRRQWRSYALRSIPFTMLGTPPSDAVLALERHGSYVLTLRGKENENESSNLALSLCFYGKISQPIV